MGKCLSSQSLPGWWKLKQRKSFPGLLDPRGLAPPFHRMRLWAWVTGSTGEIQPLWALGLWAYLGSGVGGEKNEGLWSQISCHLHTV